MAEKVLMLALSPTMKTGIIQSWSMKEGDEVAMSDVLCEVETDKAAMDYESTQEGILLKIILKEGEGAGVGQTIAIIGEKGEDISEILKEVAAEKSAPAETPPAAEVKAPAESPKSQAGSTTPAAPALQTAPGTPATSATSATPGASLAPVATPKTSASGNGNGSHVSASIDLSEISGDRVKASPLAKRIAGEKGIQLTGFMGSGPGGRIIERDLKNINVGGLVPAGSTGIQTPFSPTTTAISGGLEDKQIPLSDKRKIIAQRLSESKFTAPHYYLKVSAVMDGLIQARSDLNKTAVKMKQKKVSMNAFLMKFCAEAIKLHPLINTSWAGDHLQQKGSIDIGTAVAVPDGLMTPVVRNCGSKGIRQIDAELVELVERARINKLKLNEITNATFTMSNLGSFGIEEFTAIINPPGSTILAIGEIKKQQVVQDDDSLKIQSLMKMTLSCDHRVVDGAVGAQFLQTLKQFMANPVLLNFKIFCLSIHGKDDVLKFSLTLLSCFLIFILTYAGCSRKESSNQSLKTESVQKLNHYSSHIGKWNISKLNLYLLRNTQFLSYLLNPVAIKALSNLSVNFTPRKVVFHYPSKKNPSQIKISTCKYEIKEKYSIKLKDCSGEILEVLKVGPESEKTVTLGFYFEKPHTLKFKVYDDEVYRHSLVQTVLKAEWQMTRKGFADEPFSKDDIIIKKIR